MVERASTLEVRKELETARGPSRPFSRARRLGRRLRRSERGTAVVEFALVLTPLFFIVFGILDFGRVLQYYNDLTQIAGQGARAAAVNQDPNGGNADSAFQNQLACRATTGELKNGISVQVTAPATPPATTLQPGDPVTVTASYDVSFLPFLGARMNWAKISLTASSTQRYESSQVPGFINGSSGC